MFPLLPNPLSTKPGRLAAFFLLYMTEGIPYGFTAIAIATQMRRKGLTPAQIGLFVGTLYLPWAWKWLVGPVVDNIHSERLGRRRGWILVMQVLMCLSLIALMPINFASHLVLFTAVVIVHNCFAATQDVAIDALACNVLAEDERGLANGLMFAGAYTGQAVGGSGVLFLTAYIGFSPTFLLVAASVLLITIVIVLPMREHVVSPILSEPAVPVTPNDGRVLNYAPSPSVNYPRKPKLEDAPPVPGILERIKTYCLEALLAFFGSRGTIAGLVFALLPAGAFALSLSLATNLAVELGFTDTQIGLLTLTTTIISAVGCVVGGYLSDLLGRRRMLAIYLAATAIPTLYLAWIMYQQGYILPHDPQSATRPAGSDAIILAFWIASIAFAIPQGLMYGTRTALFMDLCTPAVAATQFTAYMAMLNLAIAYSSWWQGQAIQHWGYPTTLLLDAVLGLICISVLPLTRAPKTPAPAEAVAA